jgi:hypothetical protein
MVENPEELELFVIEWMATYSNISGTVVSTDVVLSTIIMLYLSQWLLLYLQDEQTMSTCNVSGLETAENQEQVTNFQDTCYLLVKYDFDWALFIQAMLNAESNPSSQ